MPCFELDKRRVQSSFGNASHSYDAMAQLQRNIGEQLLKNPPKLQGTVLDVGCGTGFLTQKLQQQGGYQQLIALDISPQMLTVSQKKLVDKSIVYLCADAEALPLANQSVDYLFSNVAIQWCRQLDKLFTGFREVLKDGGELYCSTFGTATLQELKQAWTSVDDYQHVNEFYSAEQLQQALHQAGFNHIHCETQRYLSEYPDIMALMKQLKGIGARNVSNGRNKQLTTKSQLQTLIKNYPQSPKSTITATFEVIYLRAKR